MHKLMMLVAFAAFFGLGFGVPASTADTTTNVVTSASTICESAYALHYAGGVPGARTEACGRINRTADDPDQAVFMIQHVPTKTYLVVGTRPSGKGLPYATLLRIMVELEILARVSGNERGVPVWSGSLELSNGTTLTSGTVRSSAGTWYLASAPASYPGHDSVVLLFSRRGPITSEIAAALLSGVVAEEGKFVIGSN